MIRIIDEKPDPELVKKISCKNCGVKLEYLPIDEQSFIHEDYGGGRETVYYINCPACSNRIMTRSI